MLDLAASHHRFCFFAEPGTGKTRTGLDIYDTRPMKTLIICPINLIDSAWIEDSEKFLGIKPTKLWHKQPKKRKELIHSDWNIAVINFESFKLNLEDFMKIGVRRLLIDESSKVKEYMSKITKAVLKFAWHPDMEEVYLFSGTPAPNSEMEYYPQIRCVSKTIFPPTKGAFKNKYFYQYGQQSWQWSMTKPNRALFEEALKQCCIFIKKEDCMDLPEQLHVKRMVELEPKQRKLYDTLEKEWIIEHEGEVTIAQTALVELMKLRQITAGFTIPNNKEAVHISDNKVSELMQIVDEIGDKQMIVVCQFKDEIRRCVEALGEKNCAQLHGAIKTGDRLNEINNFKNNVNRYLVCHPLSAGHGLTFVNCSYMTIMSQSYSLEQYLQIIQRIHRYGQINKCTYYHLISPNTIDETIWKVTQDKADLSMSILEKLKRGI